MSIDVKSPLTLRPTEEGEQTAQTRDEQMTADICVTAYPLEEPASKWPELHVSAAHPLELNGGVKFLQGVRGGVATGYWDGVDLYRVSHKHNALN